MQRQLVKQGATTLMVSLPKDWLDRQGLAKGDSVNISPLPDKLVIARGELKVRTKKIDIVFGSADYENIRNILGTLYRQGYESINVRFKDPRCLLLIQMISKSIHGFELVEQDEKGCRIENFTKELAVDVSALVSKVINIVKAEFMIVREYLVSGEKGKRDELQMMRDDCWKYKNMVYVQLREQLMLSGLNDYFKVHLLEYNTSFLLWLYREFDRSQLKKVSPELLNVYDEVAEYFTASMSLIHKDPKKCVDYVMKNRDPMFRRCHEFIAGGTDDAFLALYLGMLVQNTHHIKSFIDKKY